MDLAHLVAGVFLVVAAATPGSASVDEGGQVLLALTPRNNSGDVGRLRLTVAASSYDIVGAEIHDPAGNVTRLRFSDLQRNRGVDDSLFRFDVPPGVDVLEAPIVY